MTTLPTTEFQKTDEAVSVSEVRNSSWEGSSCGKFLWLHWVVANTGWHGDSCGTSGPAARAHSVALGGLQYVYQ